jgi:hypothetical protein
MDIAVLYAPARDKFPEILQHRETFQKGFLGNLSCGKHIPAQGNRLARPVQNLPVSAGQYFRHQEPDAGGAYFEHRRKTIPFPRCDHGSYYYRVPGIESQRVPYRPSNFTVTGLQLLKKLPHKG